MTDNAPGWQPDPTGKHDHRYWDGSGWTENVSDAGVASIDPYDPAVTAVEETVADAPAAPEPPAPLDPTVVEPAASAADTTAAWPTTPAAPGAPAPPPPYVPTSPVSSGGGGSKRGLLVGGAILAAVALAVIAFLALGGDDDDTNVRAQLASALRREADLSSDDADCVADFFVDDLGEDAFEGVDFDAAEAPEELQDAFIESGAQAVEECNIDESALDGSTDGSTDDTDGSTDGDAEEGSYGSDPELDALYDDCEAGDFEACDDLFNQSPSGSEYEDFADSCGDRNEPDGYCVPLYENGGPDSDGGTTDSSDGFTDSSDLPDGFEDTLADTYETTFNLERDKAECLAGKLTEAIESGELNEEEAMSEFFTYLEDCDISMEEISN